MCEPVMIASLALTALSTGLGHAANQKVEGARNDALAAERIRQRGLDDQAAALNTQSQDRFQNVAAKQEDRSKSLADYYTNQPAEAPTNSPVPVSDSNITVAAENKSRGDAKQRTDQIGTALGELRSFGDLFGDLSRLQARDASEIGQIGGFKRGSTGVLGLELDDAQSAGNGLKLGADIAGGLGKVGLSAGLSGVGSAGANSIPNSASPFAFGSGGYVGKGPFLNPGKPNLFSMFGG
jgi:hypothetical protein